MSIRTKIIGLLVGVFMLTLLANVFFIDSSQNEQAEAHMLENARIMAAEMAASWDFIDMNQERIDTDRDGTHNFKGIYCAVAGRGISLLFMDRTDYILRYVSSDPRNPVALADSFESSALSSFEDGAVEFYASTPYDGEPSFRYAAPIRIEESCLACHGSPAGEMDETYHEKEGMQVGDLAGAISIVIPSKIYLNSINDNIREQIVFSAGVLILIVFVIFFAMEKLVSQPLGEISGAISEVKKGSRHFTFHHASGSNEIGTIATEFTDMAETLKSVQDDLESRVEERTAELQALNKTLKDQQDKLRQMNELLKQEISYKSDFFTIMGHELKTPLTSILAYIDLWESRTDLPNSFSKATLEEAKANGRLLLQMIDNILDSARIDANRMELCMQYVDLGDVIRSAAGRLSVLASKKAIEVSVHVAPEVSLAYADEDKIRRIMENLLSNAIKYTGEGGLISVNATAADNGRVAVIKVTDNGVGIEPENLSKVFARFSRFCNDQGIGGSGLGLSVAKELAEMHGGTISVESEPGRGSSFFVTIPLSTKDANTLFNDE